MNHYFIRVNGKTCHNNPNDVRSFVPSEPPEFPATEFNYLEFCLQNGIVRHGWPDTGDLTDDRRRGKLARAYDIETIDPHVASYLHRFQKIQVGSVVVVPDKDHSGDLYVGAVTGPYHYFHDVPDHPYECAHRLKVDWDRQMDGQPVVYRAKEFNITTRGGFWLRAFAALDDIPTGQAAISLIQTARKCFEPDSQLLSNSG